MPSNMDELAEKLRGAIETDETIVVVYNGGTRPGESRQVRAISVKEGTLTAVENRRRKMYKLAKIAHVEFEDGTRIVNADAPAAPAPLPVVPAFDTLAEYLAIYRAELSSLGWEVEESEHNFEHEFKLIKRYRIGIREVSESVLIRYVDFENKPRHSRLEVDENGEVVGASTGNERPWTVSSWHLKEYRYFKKARSAFALFLSGARLGPPKLTEASQ